MRNGQKKWKGSLHKLKNGFKFSLKYSPSMTKKIINDGITNIVGTLGPENSESFEIRYITFLGFKCISRKTYF